MGHRFRISCTSATKGRNLTHYNTDVSNRSFHWMIGILFASGFYAGYRLSQNCAPTS